MIDLEFSGWIAALCLYLVGAINRLRVCDQATDEEQKTWKWNWYVIIGSIVWPIAEIYQAICWLRTEFVLIILLIIALAFPAFSIQIILTIIIVSGLYALTQIRS